MRAPIVAILLVSSACASAPPQPVVRMVLRDSVRIAGPGIRGGELTPQQLKALVPRVRAIQLEQGVVQIAPGDTFSAPRFVVRVLDSAGVTLGHTRIYDFSLMIGAAAMEPPPIIRGMHEGESQMRFAFPSRLWEGRTDAPPETFLRIVVRPRSAGTIGVGGGMRLSDRVRTSYTMQVEMADSGARRTRMPLLVLFRAQPEWCVRPCADQDARTLADSVDALRVGAQSRGGSFSGGSEQGVVYGFEIDRHHTQITLLGRTIPLATDDSTTIVLVDRVDHVGGPPILVDVLRTRIVWPGDPFGHAEATRAGGSQGDRMRRAAMTDSLLIDALRSVPVAHDFVTRPPPR